MKKLGLVVVGGTLLMLLWAASALAGSELPQPRGGSGVVVSPSPSVSPGVTPGVTQPPGVPGEVAGPPAGVSPEVLGKTVSPPSGLAFTGGTIRLWMVLAAVLLMAGVALLIATRRRLAAATE